MKKIDKIWVFSDSLEKYATLLCGANDLSDDVSAIWIGDEAGAKKLATQGAAKVYWCQRDDSSILEDYMTTVAKVIGSEAKKALVLISATKRGKAIAAKLSVALKVACVNDGSVIQVAEDGSVSVKHMVFGGLALGEEKLSSNIAIVTAGNSAFEPKEMSSQGEVVNVQAEKRSSGIVCKERKAKKQGGVDLTSAKHIVGVGRGIGKQEDLAMVAELAQVLTAEMGCSRPIAEAEQWMDRDLYIGVTGVQIKPDLYLAVGISGQIQHMVGASAAQTIFAINKDKSAPIFQMADYGIVGDLYKVLPALTKLLK